MEKQISRHNHPPHLMLAGNIHPKEIKSWNEGKGTAKQIRRLQRREARKLERKP